MVESSASILFSLIFLFLCLVSPAPFFGGGGDGGVVMAANDAVAAVAAALDIFVIGCCLLRTIVKHRVHSNDIV